MGKIELSIENPFATKCLRMDRKPSVFNRVFARLSAEGLNPGKVIPIFIRIDGDYKTFGALTLNTGGSVSFFPDFHKLDHFDHLTLNADFIQNKGHLTKVEPGGKRARPIRLEANALENGYYHLITFGMADSDLLMDAPPQIELPEILYTSEEERAKFNGWLNDAVSAGHCILEFPETDGFYCIQILVFPKTGNTAGAAIDRSPLERLLSSPASLENEIFITKKIEIETAENCDFSICILTFRTAYEMNTPFGFFMAQDPSKPLPKDVAFR